MAIKFKKGDQVIVIAGSNKGKTGNIVSIRNDKVLIGGVNLATVHKKPTSNKSGEIIEVAKPIHISNVSYIENDKPVKLGFEIVAGSSKKFAGKVRISKKTKKMIQ